MKRLKQLFILLFALGASCSLFVGCDDEPDDLGEAIEDTADAAKDAVEDAGDEIEDATQ